MTSTAPRFDFWDAQEPASFLAFDHDAPSRAVAAALALGRLFPSERVPTLLEVGPGPGVDYARFFRPHVELGRLRYVGVEGSSGLHADLVRRFPESAWRLGTIDTLRRRVADVVYVRSVLEHQLALEPALSLICAAARRAVVLTWYRPPADEARCDWYDLTPGIPAQTYRRADVVARVAKAGFRVAEEVRVAGSTDLIWCLDRC